MIEANAMLKGRVACGSTPKKNSVRGKKLLILWMLDENLGWGNICGHWERGQEGKEERTLWLRRPACRTYMRHTYMKKV